MNIGIEINRISYTPEAYAYQRFLENAGWNVQLEYENNLSADNDINIYFMGLRPFWQPKKGKALEIHEYQSLSTGSFSKQKNVIKKIINKKPSARIFLNNIVYEEMRFKNEVPYIFRDMGIDEALFQVPDSTSEFDVVYSGSIVGRVGLVEKIVNLAKKNFSILLVGEIPNSDLDTLSSYSNITCVGRVSRVELPELYRKCRMGLNYTPDIYPFNIQTSTKTLEYLASGLGLISNSYFWIDEFSKINNFEYLRLEDLVNPDTFDMSDKYACKNIKNFSWFNILSGSNFLGFLEGIYNNHKNNYI